MKVTSTLQLYIIWDGLRCCCGGFSGRRSPHLNVFFLIGLELENEGLVARDTSSHICGILVGVVHSWWRSKSLRGKNYESRISCQAKTSAGRGWVLRRADFTSATVTILRSSLAFISLFVTTYNYSVLPFANSKGNLVSIARSFWRARDLGKPHEIIPYLAEGIAYEGVKCLARVDNRSTQDHHKSCFQALNPPQLDYGPNRSQEDDRFVLGKEPRVSS